MGSLLEVSSGDSQTTQRDARVASLVSPTAGACVAIAKPVGACMRLSISRDLAPHHDSGSVSWATAKSCNSLHFSCTAVLIAIEMRRMWMATVSVGDGTVRMQLQSGVCIAVLIMPRQNSFVVILCTRERARPGGEAVAVGGVRRQVEPMGWRWEGSAREQPAPTTREDRDREDGRE